jgi:hypothetical protein
MAFATWLRLDDVTPVEFGPARGMQMTGTRMTIFLNDYYSFDIEELRERMAVVGEINVPPNQTLMIKDPLLLKFVAMYEEGAELGDLGLYVSDQFTLFLNRWIVPSGFTSQFFAEEGMLTLYHSDGFRLQLSPDSSAVTNLFDIDVYFDELNKRNKLNELNAQKLVEEFTAHILSL